MRTGGDIPARLGDDYRSLSPPPTTVCPSMAAAAALKDVPRAASEHPSPRSPSPVVERSPAPQRPPSEGPARQASLAPSRDPTPAVDAAATPAAPATPAPAPDDDDAEADPSETIDIETFHQILDLDEDDTHDFSKGMAWAYFTQASTTFTEMDEAYTKKDLAKLSSLGHFLKGSSAALGVAKVQATCEQIQHYGQLRDEESGTDLTEDVALERIGALLARVKKDYVVAEAWLKKWYAENSVPGEDDEDA